MSDPEREDLRATAEDVAADAERLNDLEQRKLELDPADPEVRELSAEGERIVRGLKPKVEAERALAEKVGGGASPS